MNEKVRTLECLGKIRTAMERCNFHYRELLCDGTDTGQVSIDNARQNIKMFLEKTYTELEMIKNFYKQGDLK